MKPITNYLANVLQNDEDALMAIREIPLFRTSSQELLELVFRYARIYSLPEGGELTREGEFDQWVYFIIGGRLDVYVGEARVDTISSSLVGERCLLGEPRKATLRAAKGGMNALGVDMALLDALNSPAQTGEENRTVYLELLGRIVGNIIQRVAEMEFNRMDIVNKYEMYRQSDQMASIVDALRQNAFLNHPARNFAIHRHLNRFEPVLLSRALVGDGHRVDTRRVYALCLEWGRSDVLFTLAREILASDDSAGDEFSGNGAAGDESPDSDQGNDPGTQESNRESDRENGQDTDSKAAPKAEPGASGGDGEPPATSPSSPAERSDLSSDFKHFLVALGSRISDRHGQSHSGGPALAVGEMRRFFTLNDDLEVDLRGITHWLKTRYGYGERELADILMLVLQEASAYTAQLNSRIQEMLRKLSEFHFFQQLSSVSEDSFSNVSTFFDSTPPEDLISYFSQNILDLHLIRPYLEKMGDVSNLALAGNGGQEDSTAQEGEGEDSPQSSSGQGLADSLFD